MVNGIIQEVYKQLLLEDKPHTDTIVTMNKFKRRLIEKIKGNRNNIEIQKGIISVKELIGDNE